MRVWNTYTTKGHVDEIGIIEKTEKSGKGWHVVTTGIADMEAALLMKHAPAMLQMLIDFVAPYDGNVDNPPSSIEFARGLIADAQGKVSYYEQN